jgi:predicted ArsR family transcriptional regulator
MACMVAAPHWARRRRSSAKTRNLVLSVLLNGVELTASEIACEARIAVSRVYRALDDLQIYGLVELNERKWRKVNR